MSKKGQCVFCEVVSCLQGHRRPYVLDKQMHKPSGGKSPPNEREAASLRPEIPTWHREPYNRDPRTDKTDRDRDGAGKRHWNGDRSSNMTSFQVVTSGAALSGNGYVPRCKPRFQGHYSGFFAETGRNGPSFSATGPLDTALVRRFYRNSNPSETSLAAKSQGFSENVGLDYRASDTEERHNQDQFLPFWDDYEGRDQSLPPHTSRVHSDFLLVRNGEKTRQLGNRNWERSPRIDRDNITSPHGNVDLYNSSSSSRRNIVVEFESEKDWGLGDNGCDVGRFGRYGDGSQKGPRADHEGSNKDTAFSHGWRRERGNSGVITRHFSFTGGSRKTGELGGRVSLSVGSANNSLHASTLPLIQNFDQPSPSKRPRLGWGQGLAKYEKKVVVSPLVEKTDMKTNGEGDPCQTVEEVEKKRVVAQEKPIVRGWVCKQENLDIFIQESEMQTTLIREDGVREVSGQDASSCAVSEDSLRRNEENARKLALAEKFQGLDRRSASPFKTEDNEKNIRGGREEKKGAFSSYDKELELHGRNPALLVLAEDNECKKEDYEVASGALQEREFQVGKDLNLTSSVVVEGPETRQGEIAKSSALFETTQEDLGRNCQDPSLAEPLNDAKHDLGTSVTLTIPESRGHLSSNSTSVTGCETYGRGIEGTLPFSPTPHLEIVAEDIDLVTPVEPSLEMSSTKNEKHNNLRSHVVDYFLAAPAPLLLTESVVSASSPNHVSAIGEQHETDMSVDERPLGEPEMLEEPEENTFVAMEIATEEILVEDPEASHFPARGEKTDFGILEPVSAVLRKELTIAQVAASSDALLSQVREQVVATTKSDRTLPESEPASDGPLMFETSTVYTCGLNDMDYAVLLDSASQTEKSILETVERVEVEIDFVKKEIAQISSELSGDVSLKVSGTRHARVVALDSPSIVAEYDDVPTLMEEDTIESLPCSDETGVVCPSSSQSSPTGVYIRFEKSPICSERDVSSTPALLLREASMTRVPEKGVLELVPRGVQLKSASFDKDFDVKDVRGARSGSISRSLGSEESDYFENHFCNEVATGASSLQERNQRMMESLIMENKERASLSAVPFVHLLSQSLAGTLDQQLYHSPIEAPVWQRNAETHKNIHDRLLGKIVERRHFIKFKERVLTLRYRALKEAWKQERRGLSARRNRPKTVGRWDSEGRGGHTYLSQRSLRLRPLSLDRVDADSDAAQAMKTLTKNPQVEALRSFLKMPTMILDEKERAVRRFVSRNALVEDPIAVEMERKTLNLWTAEERKIFAENFAVHNKNFKEIASYLQYKTTADCVEYYYRNKKSEEFGKSQHGIQMKNRWDHTKSSSAFLTPTAARIHRSHEANCARIKALNVANMNIKLSQGNSQLQVSELANPSIDSFTMPSNVEMPKFPLKECKALELVLPCGATMETATSSLISTPCSVSSTAAHLIDQWKEKDLVEERIRTGPSTTKSSHSDQHPAGLKGIRSTHLRCMSSRTAAQEDSQWTDSERELFTNAVATYGKDFRVIASHVRTKSESQCKAFFSKTRKRLRLDELVEQFQAYEAASMLVHSFRHDAGLEKEVKLMSTSETNASAGGIAEELINTAAAVSTLESLKERSKCLAIDMSDLTLVADAAAVMEEITLVKPEVPTLDLFSSDKSRTSSQDLACELLKVNRSNFPFTLLRKEEDEDSEATKSDGSYLVGTESKTDIVVDQAAAALIGMSEMLADKSESKRSKSEAKADIKSSPFGVFSRSQSTCLPTSSPLHAVMETNLCLTSGRTARHSNERVNAPVSCKTRDRPEDMHDVHTARKCRDLAGCEPKPRREPTSWTQEEKEKFAVILQEHGKDWALLHESLPSKSLIQIKTYFQNSKARSRLPALDKFLPVVRNDGANGKRKADDFESTRRSAELALPVKPKVRVNVAPFELDSAVQKEDTLLSFASFSETAGVGVDILSHAARFGTFPGQSADQNSLSMNGVQHLVRRMVSASTYTQGSTQDGHQVFLPGANPALPSPVVTPPHTPGGIQQLLSGPGPSKAVGPDLQALYPGVVSQVCSPTAIHQVAQQVQQMLQQQRHLQKQLNLLTQQQAALPLQLLPQHRRVTQQTLQAVRPLEEKLHQVVQQLQQQYELQGRGQASCKEEGHSHMDYFQHQHVTPQRGILKVKPIRGVVPEPLVDLATSPSSDVLLNQAESRNEYIQLQQQHHSLSLGMGTIPAVTAGSTVGVQENHAKTVELQDSDSDTDCEGIGSRPLVTEDLHQRMSLVHSTSSGQQQNTTQSTTSSLSSDSEQVKSWDVKLFGQSLLSKPPPLPSSLPHSAGSLMQAFLNPNISAPMATMTFPTGTLSKGFRNSESLSSAFGRVGASSVTAGRQQQPTSRTGKYGVWSTASSFQLSGVTELTRKQPDSESGHECVTSLAAQLDGKVLVLALKQTSQGDDEHLDSESGNLSSV